MKNRKKIPCPLSRAASNPRPNPTPRPGHALGVRVIVCAVLILKAVFWSLVLTAVTCAGAYLAFVLFVRLLVRVTK